MLSICLKKRQDIFDMRWLLERICAENIFASIELQSDLISKNILYNNKVFILLLLTFMKRKEVENKSFNQHEDNFFYYGSG